MKTIFTIVVLCIFTSLLNNITYSKTNKSQIHLLTVDGAINPVSEGYILTGIENAAKSYAECLIIELNTPGGLLSSTRKIVAGMLKSPIPIIVYVSPGGAQAASAGVFITLASNIAAMAPGTNIGAAHPVTLQGQSDSIMMVKATNDAVAFIKSISSKRDRNVQWAEDAVRKSVSATESEAIENHIIDLIAENVNDLLKQLDSSSVKTASGERLLNTNNAQITKIEMTFQQKLLDILSDPNIAYILLMIGIYGLFFELYNPGAIFPGVVGVISLILAFYSLHTLPVNYAGVGLIILSIILFILEIKIISHGLLSIGGVISLFLGSIMLFNTGSFFNRVFISIELVISVVLLTLLFFLFIIGAGLKAQSLKPTTGTAGLMGETGTSLSDLNPNGQVLVHGEIWSAESIEGNINKGQQIIIDQIVDLNLKVKRLNHDI